MNKKSTLNYLLNTEESEKCDIIDTNRHYDDDFNEFNDVFEKLNTVNYSPSDLVVKNLVQFAQAYELIELESGRKVEMILN